MKGVPGLFTLESDHLLSVTHCFSTSSLLGSISFRIRSGKRLEGGGVGEGQDSEAAAGRVREELSHAKSSSRQFLKGFKRWPAFLFPKSFSVYWVT